MPSVKKESSRLIRLDGLRFGRLLVVKRTNHAGRTEAHWSCRCDCGNITTVSGGCLRRGDTKSCGCWNKEIRLGAWPCGEQSPLWKGGRSERKDGYITVYVGTGTHDFEHIVLMEQKLGRKLLPKETVHHKNGVRNDNHDDNLELWSSSHPPGQRVVDKVEWATDILKLYAPERLSDV